MIPLQTIVLILSLIASGVMPTIEEISLQNALQSREEYLMILRSIVSILSYDLHT